MKIPAEPKVILRSCRDYDPERIRTIIREGLEELGLRPSGRTLVKPNLVASGPLFPYAYTRPEFGEGVLRALRDVGGSAMTELAAGERCGITVPTRVSLGSDEPTDTGACSPRSRDITGAARPKSARWASPKRSSSTLAGLMSR